MSSEQRYDYSYEHFVEDDLHSFDLFGESVGTSSANLSSFELPEDYSANSQRVRQLFYNETYNPDQNQQIRTVNDIAGYAQFEAFDASQPSTSIADDFAPLDLATTLMGDLCDQDDEFRIFSNTAGRSQIDFSGFEASSPSVWGIDGVS